MVMTDEERREAQRASSRRYYARNKDKMQARDKTEARRTKSREWARANRDKVRNNFLRRKFGITLDDYRAMAEAQGHRCAICGKTRDEEGRDLSVDHCHATGKVRKLLCTACNTDLAVLEKCSTRLQRMIDYIKENQ